LIIKNDIFVIFQKIRHASGMVGCPMVVYDGPIDDIFVIFQKIRHASGMVACPMVVYDGPIVVDVVRI
jgi:hypothetical protein